MFRFVAAIFLVVSLGRILSAATLIVDASRESHSGDGSVDKPFATISQAAQVAQPGDHVIVRAGIYRENVRLKRSGTPTAPIYFDAETPGTVVVTGADLTTGWQRLDGTEPIYHIPWRYVFAIDHDSHGRAIEHHPDDQPLWGRAEQFIADGKVLLPCKDLSDLRAAWNDRTNRLASPTKGIGGPFPGMFAVDTSIHQAYLWLADGSNPNQSHAIEASVRSQIFGINEFESAAGVHDIHLNGFIFRYAANFPQRAAVVLHGHDNLIEHCLIENMNGTGAEVNGTLRDCLIRNNGHTGGSADGDGFLNEHCLWKGNCWKPIDRGWESGGAKVTDSRGGKFIDCIFHHNGGPGLWFDIDCRDIDVQNCDFIENEESGLFIEISQNIRATNNTLIANATNAIGHLPDDGWSCGGIQIGESQHCLIQNNTLIGNRDGIALREIGPRTVKTRGEQNTYHTTNITITGNTIADSTGYQIALWWDNVFFGPHPSSHQPYGSHEQWAQHLAELKRGVYDPLAQHLQIDGNTFFKSQSFLYGVPWRIESKKLHSLADFTAATGFQKSGRVTDDPPAAEPAATDHAATDPAAADTAIAVKISSFDPFAVH
jgi:hypothetical protein